MAGGTLGSLTVKLGLDAAEFTGGLSRADYEAKKFAEGVGRAIDTGVSVAMLALATAAGTAFLAVDKLIKSAGDFQDLAEKTGASAEGLASFAVAAGTAGTSVDAIAAASIRLTKGLTGVDDESKAVGAALGALGLKVSDFKKLSPEDQISAISKALAGYADGAGKTAVATALFGKSGAELLPFLKALEEQGGRQVILTDKQIQQADEYADNQARLAATTTQYAQRIATEALPVFSQIIDLFTGVATAEEVAGEASSVFQIALNGLVVVFQTISVLALEFAFVFKSVGREIGGTIAQIAAIGRGDFKGLRVIADSIEEDGVRARADLDKTIAKIMAVNSAASNAAQKFQSDPTELARRGRPVGGNRPTLTFGGVDTDKAKKQVDEALKYLETLQKQLNKTRELSAEETVLSDIQSGRLKLSTAVTQEQLVAVARLIDQSKEASKVAEERAARRRKDDEDSIKAIQDIEQAERSRLKSLLDSGIEATRERERKSLELLNQALADGRISWEQFNDAAGSLNLSEQLEKTKSLSEEIGLAFTSSFEQAISSGNSFRDVLKGLTADVLKLLARQYVTKPLTDGLGSLFNGGGGGASGIGSFISSLFGGGRANGGSVMPGSLYQVNERGPEVLDVGGKSFLMMGKDGGVVTPTAGGRTGGSGGKESIAVINQTTGRVDTAYVEEISPGQKAIILQENRRTIATDMTNPNSEISRSMQATFNLQRRR